MNENVTSQKEFVQLYLTKAAELEAQDPEKAAAYRRRAEVIESWAPEDAAYIAHDFTRLQGG
jgi:hypothetical protein